MPKYETFNYWFTYLGGSRYQVYTKSEGVCRPHTVISAQDILEADPNTPWLRDWEMFIQRPEYAVTSNAANAITGPGRECTEMYKEYIRGCALLRANKYLTTDPDLEMVNIDKVLDWLDKSDFFTAPASSQYHESEPGGLCYHTLKVAARLHDLIQCEPFSRIVAIESATLTALVHDWCKIGLYESFDRNVKDPKTGAWHQVKSFRRKSAPMSCLGHGVSSMYIAANFFKLSHEESLAIRWHQGRWNVCREEMNELQQANETFPLVHLLQFADQLAIVKY